MQSYKGVIFDLDGTLLDSMQIWKNIDVKFLAKRNIDVPEDYMESISHLGAYETALYTINRFNLKDTPEELISEWINMALIEYEKVNLKPGAQEYINYLIENNIKIAIATATEPEIIEAALHNKSFYKHIDTIVRVSEVSRGKEFPDIYFKCAQNMNLSPKDCIVFEDILVAITSSKSGGFYTIAVHDECSKDTQHLIKKICDKYIYDFKELI